MLKKGRINVRQDDPSVKKPQLRFPDGTPPVEGLENIKKKLSEISSQPQPPPSSPNTNIKAVCAVLQQDKLEEEIPKFEAENAQFFPEKMKGFPVEVMKRNDLANGSVRYSDPTFARAVKNHKELLQVLEPLNPSGDTTQPQRPKSTEWQKKLIEYIRNKEVAEFNAKRPGAKPITKDQYHFTNVEGEDTKDCAKGPNGKPLPGPRYEDQQSPEEGGLQPDPGPEEPGLDPGGGGGGGGLGQLLPALLQALGNLGKGGGGQPSGGGGQPSSGSGQQQPESSPRPTEEGFPADTDRDRDRVDLSQVLRDIARSGLPDSLVEQIVKVVLTVILQLVRGGTSGGTTTFEEMVVPWEPG